MDQTSADDPMGSVNRILGNPSASIRLIGICFNLNLPFKFPTNGYNFPFLHSSCKTPSNIHERPKQEEINGYFLYQSINQYKKKFEKK